MKWSSAARALAIVASACLVACGAGQNAEESVSDPSFATAHFSFQSFAGNYVKITGTRHQVADPKYPCASSFSGCFPLDAAGNAGQVKRLCSSDDTPSGADGQWDFTYELFNDASCGSKLANIVCPPQMNEVLVNGGNANHIECRTRNGDKGFDFCLVDPYTGAGRENCPAAAKTVLLLAPSLTAGATMQEKVQAEALGFVVEVVDPNGWAAKTEAQFASYRALIIPDNDTGPLPVAEATRTTWSPAVTGNIFISGSDFDGHCSGPWAEVPRCRDALRYSIGFAAYKPYETGLFASLGHYSQTQVALLDQFGQFVVTPGLCDDGVSIVNTGPVLDAITAATLDNWFCSVHEIFNTVQNPSICKFAKYNAANLPYMVARGLDTCN